ncbi:MAG: hypothetical protein LKK13_02475 [Bacilli bacterium]|nr:hypothetical protein [Bacilli bacterium]
MSLIFFNARLQTGHADFDALNLFIELPLYRLDPAERRRDVYNCTLDTLTMGGLVYFLGLHLRLLFFT